MKFRTNYQPQTWDEGTTNNEPSKVQPEHEQDLEINSIMDRYTRTGYLPPNEVAQVFKDLSIPEDFDSIQKKS